MEWESTLRYVQVSPRKARLVADLVRGMNAGKALDRLRFTPKRGGGLIKKVVQSAVANASRSHGVDEDKLFISHITVDEGPTMKRWSPRAMGRATRIRKRTSHIRVAVQEAED